MEEIFESENNQEVAELETGTQDPQADDTANTEPAETESVESVEVADQQEGETDTEQADEPARDYEKDAAFASMRRENQQLLDAIKMLGFEADNTDELAIQAESYATGRNADEIRAEREEKTKVEQLEAELETLRKRESERVFKDDLEQVKTAYPDLKAKNIFDLGEEFLKLRASGVDPVIAYEAIKAKEARETKEKPVSTGSVKSTAKVEKDFFTADEVKRMTADEVRKNMDIIDKSMKKWR